MQQEGPKEYLRMHIPTVPFCQARLLSGGIEDFEVVWKKLGVTSFEIGHIYKISWKYFPDEEEERCETGGPIGTITKAEFCFPGTCMKECLDEWYRYDLERPERSSLKRQNAEFFSSQEP